MIFCLPFEAFPTRINVVITIELISVKNGNCHIEPIFVRKQTGYMLKE